MLCGGTREGVTKQAIAFSVQRRTPPELPSHESNAAPRSFNPRLNAADSKAEEQRLNMQFVSHRAIKALAEGVQGSATPCQAPRAMPTPHLVVLLRRAIGTDLVRPAALFN